MGSNISKKIISLLLALLLVVTLFPMTAWAGYEDGQECWLCGHYHWDEYMCGMCGACSIECTNASCFVAAHCNECGTCLDTEVFCSDCRRCEECFLSDGAHCSKCQDPTKCFYTDPDGLCGSCWGCEDCVGTICDTCGFCDDCQVSEGGMHCPDCNSCFLDVGNCQADNQNDSHCADCCQLCESCENCYYEEGIFLCDFCGLCPDCCAEVAEDNGCSCAQYCVESSDWFEHVCTDCGAAFCEIDQCEYCGFCLDCCESMSDCIDGMCVENPDYDYHFCVDCGDCFCVNDLCESCDLVGELRCSDCCAVLTADEGCDCGDRCFNEDDFAWHVTYEHAGQDIDNHSATPQSGWEMDATGHWHACRYCTDPAHSKIGFGAHALNKYGICESCGFDSFAKILILKQPQSRVVTVTDYGAEQGDPLNAEDNQVTFVTAARGLSELSYQWYFSTGGNWIKLVDHTTEWWPNGDSFEDVEGAKTPTLTVSVPSTCCYETYSYKCVITDAENNTVETAVASIRSQHVYKGEMRAEYGEQYHAIAQYGPNIPVYHTSGHWVECIGDSCTEEILVPHRFSKETRILVDQGTNQYGVPMGDGSEWMEYTCLDCGGKKYEKLHEHYYVDPETGDCDIDYGYEDELQHQMQCLFSFKGVRCDYTTRENHAFMGYRDMGTPHTAPNGIGISYRECQVCSYQNTKKPEKYDPSSNKMVAVDWTKNNDLVHVDYGYADTQVTAAGEQIRVTFDPTAYEKLYEIEKEYPVCIAWSVYYIYEKNNGYPVETNVSSHFSFTKETGKPTWKVSIPNFSGYTGGGIFVFRPIVDSNPCAHNHGTRIKGAYDPICVKDGYTGDTVCVDCGYVVQNGQVIPSYGRHTGTLTLNPLTVQQGTCDHRGYSGTSRCSVCKMSVRGNSTPKVHTGLVSVTGYVAPTCYDFGYSGDTYCSCGELLEEGTLLAPDHKEIEVIGYVAPSASKSGYSGDLKCKDCDLILRYGYTIPKDRVIENIVITGLTAPVAGQHPTYEVTLGSDKYSLDIGATSYRRNGIYWYANYEPFYPNQNFRGGFTYRVNIVLKANGANFFAGDVTATVNGKTAKIIPLNDPEYIQVQYTFDDIPKALVQHIDVTGVQEPVVGKMPSWNYQLSQPSLYYVDTFSWEANDEYWYAGEPFSKGKKYTLYMQIEANWSECDFSPNTTVNINGKPAEVLDVRISEYVQYVYLKYDYGYLTDYMAIGDLYGDWKVSPVETAVFKVTAAGINSNDIALFDKDFNEVKFNTKKQGFPLVKGQQYTVRLRYNGTTVHNATFVLTKVASTLFPDTSAEAWYNEAVTYAVGRGFINGYGNGTFGPSDSIQRQDFLVMLARLEGVDLSQYEQVSGVFTDVQAGTYYAAAVHWGYEKGIVTGYQNGSFGVGDVIIREQLVTFLWRYAKYKGLNVSVAPSVVTSVQTTFADYNQISDYALDAVYWAVDRKVIKGKTATTVAPMGSAQRCEVAQMMYNIFLNDIF